MSLASMIQGEFYTTNGSGSITPLKKHTDWRKTWQLIVPGNFGGNSYTDLLFYNLATGEGEFYTTDGCGNISLLKKHTDWRKTWKLIVPGNFGGNDYTDLLFYDTTTNLLQAGVWAGGASLITNADALNCYKNAIAI